MGPPRSHKQDAPVQGNLAEWMAVRQPGRRANEKKWCPSRGRTAVDISGERNVTPPQFCGGGVVCSTRGVPLPNVLSLAEGQKKIHGKLNLPLLGRVIKIDWE